MDRPVVLEKMSCVSHIATKNFNFGAANMSGEKTTMRRGSKADEKVAVNGGWVKRDASSGRFKEVGTSSHVAKASAASEATVKEASSRQSAALKRLADR